MKRKKLYKIKVKGRLAAVEALRASNIIHQRVFLGSGKHWRDSWGALPRLFCSVLFAGGDSQADQD